MHEFEMQIVPPRKPGRLSRQKPMVAVDLFCGAGGLARGLLDSGIEVAAGYDIDPSCRYPFEFNNGNARFEMRDVNSVTSDEVAQCYPSKGYRILVGCAPCQPFSSYSRQHRRHSNDDRWSLLRSFSRIAHDIRPDVISMENVTQLMQHDSYTEFRDSLTKSGYCVSEPALVFGPDYGLPQQRRRLLLFASLRGTIEVISPTRSPKDYVTLFDAIGDLEPLVAGGSSTSDNLHMSCRLSKSNLARIKAASPGGTWRDWPASSVSRQAKRCYIPVCLRTYGMGQTCADDYNAILRIRQWSLWASIPTQGNISS